LGLARPLATFGAVQAAPKPSPEELSWARTCCGCLSPDLEPAHQPITRRLAASANRTGASANVAGTRRQWAGTT
jgi:hypothetical protein